LTGGVTILAALKILLTAIAVAKLGYRLFRAARGPSVLKPRSRSGQVFPLISTACIDMMASPISALNSVLSFMVCFCVWFGNPNEMNITQ
jgi:hypothetical protein